MNCPVCDDAMIVLEEGARLILPPAVQKVVITLSLTGSLGQSMGLPAIPVLEVKRASPLSPAVLYPLGEHEPPRV